MQPDGDTTAVSVSEQSPVDILTGRYIILREKTVSDSINLWLLLDTELFG